MNCGAGQTTQKVPMSLLRGLRGSWALAASAVVSSTLISSTVMSPKWCTPEEDKKEAAILAELKKFKGGVVSAPLRHISPHFWFTLLRVVPFASQSDAKAREILASLKVRMFWDL